MCYVSFRNLSFSKSSLMAPTACCTKSMPFSQSELMSKIGPQEQASLSLLSAPRSSRWPLVSAQCSQSSAKPYLAMAWGPPQWHRGAGPKFCRLSDWAHVTGATSAGPDGMTALQRQHLSPAKQQDVLPHLLQWCRISKTMPRLLFHVVWMALFPWLEVQVEQAAVGAFKQQYFLVEDELLQAAWRSAPDRAMPGTGSAPQESWHEATLKEPCRYALKNPYTLTQAFSAKVVEKQLRVIRAMSSRGRCFQDWPGIGNSRTGTPSTMTLPLPKRAAAADSRC